MRRSTCWRASTTAGIAVLVLVGTLTGCGAERASPAACTSQIRLDGIVYSGYSWTDRPAPATRLDTTAEVADCADVGQDARGSVFPDDPQRVRVWSFDGHPTEDVLGVRRDDGAFEVFTAASLPDADRDRLVEQLEAAAEPAGGGEPITDRALAAAVVEHTGEPATAGPAEDLEELGDGLAAGVDLRYGPDTSDGHLLTVGVGRDFAAAVGDTCAAWAEHGVSGCAETRDGLLAWEAATPEEDPGVVYVLASKGGTDVVLVLSGLEISGDPRELDLPVAVEDLFAVAADPRVDLTTSPEAVEAGRDLASWSDSGP